MSTGGLLILVAVETAEMGYYPVIDIIHILYYSPFHKCWHCLLNNIPFS